MYILRVVLRNALCPANGLIWNRQDLFRAITVAEFDAASVAIISDVSDPAQTRVSFI